MTSIVPLDAAKSWEDHEAFDAAPLIAWGRRIGADARKGIRPLAPLLPDLSRLARARAQALTDFFGASALNHAFCVDDLNWLWLHEPQITKAFVSFLERGDAAHVLAFLKALDPDRHWPSEVNELHVEAEMPTRKGFIDILIKYRSGAELYGAVIEAKFGHDAKSNPFSDYRSVARSDVFQGNDSNVSYRILGEKQCVRTSRMVARSTNPWQFVSWFAFLRKLEAELAGTPIYESFARFRRVVWERIL